MGGKEQLIDLQEFLSDILRGVSNLNKMVEDLSKTVSASRDNQAEYITQRLDKIEDYFQSMKETTELLNELLAELRLLVPVLHLNKLIDETKSYLASGRYTASAESSFTSRDESIKYGVASWPQLKPAPKIAEETSPFASTSTDERAKQPQTQPIDKEPDVIYSSKVPSYIKEKKKPKSIWTGIRDEEEPPK